MVIKLYISGISGNKEVKKKQQRVQMILDSKQIDYEAIDITEPGKEKDKEFMQQNGKVRESLGKYPLPPQIFNDDDFCGDYEDFDMANEVDELEKFLHIETISKELENDSKPKEESGGLSEPLNTFSYNRYDYHTYRIKWNCVNGMQEQIIELIKGENEQSEEITKTEVNGESEGVLPSGTPSENVVDNSEFLNEVLDKEETEKEKDSIDENSETKNEEMVTDATEKLENETEEKKVKEEEKLERVDAKEDTRVEEAKEETVEDSKIGKLKEEESPHEEKEDEDDVDNKTKDEKESDNEDEDEDSPQSEKEEK